nr:hypothetical protein [Pandoravirus massiliensis]
MADLAATAPMQPPRQQKQRQQQQHDGKSARAPSPHEKQQRRRGSCMQRLLVGELRSYSTAFEGMAMLDTVVTALIAGVINSGRVYPGARVLSLTALDQDSYPPGSGLCTMVCVVRWCGPPGVTWVATDLDLDPSRFPKDDIIAGGTPSDGLLVEFQRAGLVHTPRISSDASRPLPPPPRFLVTALRPRLCATVDVAPDGSISRRRTEPPGARDEFDRIWNTSIPLIRPSTAARHDVEAIGRCISAALPRDTASARVTRAIAKAIVSSLASTKNAGSAAVYPIDDSPARTRRPRPNGPAAAAQPHPTQPQQSRKRQSPQDARCCLAEQIVSTTVPTSQAVSPAPDLQQRPARAHTAPPVPAATERDGTRTSRPIVATSPMIIVHARCAAVECRGPSRTGTGKIVRVECTAGCRVTLHRTCWRAMAIDPSDTRPCMTPDCWGHWSRVTSTRRAADGSEAVAYVEWTRILMRSAEPTTRAREKRTRAANSAGDPRPSVAAKASAPTAFAGGPRPTVAEADDTYVGRIRRRRLRQKQSGPPHKRLESVKALARPLVSECAGTATPPVVVAGGARVESAPAEQEATRAKRRLANMPPVRGPALATTAMVPSAKKTRASARARKGSRAGNVDVEVPSKDANPKEAVTVVPAEANQADSMPMDLNGAWAAFFEWDRVPPSLVPETAAARPTTEGMWTPPPLLVMADGGADLCCPAAVWSCFCQRAMAA